MRYTLNKNIVKFGLYLVLDNGQPTNAYASEKAVFKDNADIKAGHFRGGVFNGGVFHDGVFHDGVFHNGIFNGGVFYDGWIPLQINGSRHFVNIPDGVHIKIGCIRLTPKQWQVNFEKIGQEENYTPHQIKEYKRYIDIASKMIEEKGE